MEIVEGVDFVDGGDGFYPRIRVPERAAGARPEGRHRTGGEAGEGADAAISPLVGEMGGSPEEGGAGARLLPLREKVAAKRPDEGWCEERGVAEEVLTAFVSCTVVFRPAPHKPQTFPKAP